jgi:uncharacterized coiled-coil protein SlyX
MKKEATLADLVSLCEKQGWEKTIAHLEKITLRMEDLQASMYASGMPSQVRKAVKMSATIARQNIAIAHLNQIHRNKPNK